MQVSLGYGFPGCRYFVRLNRMRYVSNMFEPFFKKHCMKYVFVDNDKTFSLKPQKRNGLAGESNSGQEQVRFGISKLEVFLFIDPL